MSKFQTQALSDFEAGRNKSPDEAVLTGSFEEGGSVKQVTEAAECLDSKKAIADTFVELGQLFYKKKLTINLELSMGKLKPWNASMSSKLKSFTAILFS